MGGEAIGVEEVKKMVQKRVDEGCDVVKVMTTGEWARHWLGLELRKDRAPTMMSDRPEHFQHRRFHDSWYTPIRGEVLG